MKGIISRLRYISLGRRMYTFYMILCLMPVGILLGLTWWNQNYQRERTVEQFENIYLNQIETQLGAFLNKYEEELVHLCENNDFQADLYLYHENTDYHTEEVKKRVADILSNTCKEEVVFTYGGVRSSDGKTLILGGEDLPKADTFQAVFQELMENAKEKPGWVVTDGGEVFCLKTQKIGMAPERSFTVLLKSNVEKLKEICQTLGLYENQQLKRLSNTGKELFSLGPSGEEESWMSEINLENGWTLKVGTGKVKGAPADIMGICLAVIVLAWGGICIYILAKSLTEPLQKLLYKFKIAGEQQTYLEDTTLRTEFCDTMSSDEHGILDLEFQRMLATQKELTDKMYVRKIEEERIQVKIRELELNAMQQQINPHFLSNILETIYWMADEKGYEQTEEMIATLGEYFKLSVSSQSEYVLVSEEIENAKSYLRILSVLYEKRFEVLWEIDRDVLPCYTIKLILQPIIENAFEHGLSKMKSGGKITIHCKTDRDQIYFIIHNNGKGMTIEELDHLRAYINDGEYDAKKSVGTKNVNLRIKLYYGNEYGLEYTSDQDSGTTAVITIPYRIKEGEAVV